MNDKLCRRAARPARSLVRVVATGLAASLIATGCTTSLSSQEDSLTAGNPPSNGIPYRLPMKQFDLAVTWTLSKCTAATSDGGAGQVEYAVSAAQTPAIVEGESRLIDYRELTNHFKTGNIKVEYHPGTLIVKSINSTIEGHEAEAVGSALKLGFNVARLFMGLPAPGAAGGSRDGRAPTPCRDETLEMIEELAKAQTRIKAIPAEAKKIEDRMAVLRLRAAGGRLSKKDRQELDKLQPAADTLVEELAMLTDSAARVKASLSYTQTWKFPSTSSEREKAFQPAEDKLKKWLTPLLRVAAVNQVKSEKFEISASLVPLVPEATCPTPECDAAPEAGGFVFRQPVEATLLVIGAGHADPLIKEKVSVPQFGRLRILPLRSRWGEKNTLSASFSDAGVPTSIEYKSENAPGVKALALGNDAAAGLLGLRGEIRGARDADEKEELADLEAERKAEVDGLKHQIALLTEQGKLAELQDGTSPELEALQAQLAILRLKKEQSDLDAAIRKNESP